MFLIHDCDAAGTIIFQSFQEETEAGPAVHGDHQPGHGRRGGDGARESGERSRSRTSRTEAARQSPDTCRRSTGQVAPVPSRRAKRLHDERFIEWLDEKMESLRGQGDPAGRAHGRDLRETWRKRSGTGSRPASSPRRRSTSRSRRPWPGSPRRSTRRSSTSANG